MGLHGPTPTKIKRDLVNASVVHDDEIIIKGAVRITASFPEAVSKLYAKSQCLESSTLKEATIPPLHVRLILAVNFCQDSHEPRHDVVESVRVCVQYMPNTITPTRSSPCSEFRGRLSCNVRM